MFAGLIVILLALSIGAYFGSLYSPDHKQYQTVTNNRSGHTDYNGPSESLHDISGLPGLVERIIANPHPEGAKDHEQRDLAAQEAMAVWAFWVLVSSGLTVVVTTLGTILIWRQISLTREAVKETAKATKAVDTTNDISRLSLIPYVHPTMAKIIEPLSEPLEADIVFENAGSTPALNAEFYTYLTGEDWESSEAYEPVAKDKAEPVGPIPPKDKRQRHMTLDRPGEAIRAFKQLRDENAPEPKLVLRGFVRYSDTFGNRYITEFAYTTDKLPLSGEAIKMIPARMTAPTYQKVDEQDQPIEN